MLTKRELARYERQIIIPEWGKAGQQRLKDSRVLVAGAGGMRALSYSNSIFHGVSGSINRTGRMAVHEALLAAGLICGSLLGGLIYQYYSMDTVYYFCTLIVVLGALLQGGLFLLLRRRDERNPCSVRE